MDLEREEFTGKKMIGYLNGEYPKSDVPEDFLRKLRALELKIHSMEDLTAGLMRMSPGYHVCEYCQNARSSADYMAGDYIWPEMLVHYISVHKYLPPKEFIDFITNS